MEESGTMKAPIIAEISVLLMINILTLVPVCTALCSKISKTQQTGPQGNNDTRKQKSNQKKLMADVYI